MSGIRELNILLSSMEPVLEAGDFVFASFKSQDWTQIGGLDPVGTFREREGMTLIVTVETALRNGIQFDAAYRLISLNVHSSLDAVGLTAAVSGKLAERNISANVVAAYYHDHIFVQKEKAEQALEAILELQGRGIMT